MYITEMYILMQI